MHEDHKHFLLLTKEMIFLYILMVVGLTLFLLSSEDADADTITVDDDGGANYLGIQDAIDNSSAGDTILVKAGFYHGNIVIDKTINLIGENPNNMGGSAK